MLIDKDLYAHILTTTLFIRSLGKPEKIYHWQHAKGNKQLRLAKLITQLMISIFLLGKPQQHRATKNTIKSKI